MRTYQSIQAEIASLQQQAAEVRAREIEKVVAKVKQTMTEYGLTAADLGFTNKRNGSTPAAAPVLARVKGRTVGVPRYRDPKTGATWTGQGRAPRWIAGAPDRDAFLIGPADTPRDQASPAGKAPPAYKGNGNLAAGASKLSKKPRSKKAASKKPASKKAAGRASKVPAVAVEGSPAGQ